MKFNGTIDEVAIYSRALSAEEIAYRYQLTAANKTGVIPAERTAGKFNTTGIYFNQPRDDECRKEIHRHWINIEYQQKRWIGVL